MIAVMLGVVYIYIYIVCLDNKIGEINKQRDANFVLF